MQRLKTYYDNNMYSRYQLKIGTFIWQKKGFQAFANETRAINNDRRKSFFEMVPSRSLVADRVGMKD